VPNEERSSSGRGVTVSGEWFTEACEDGEAEEAEEIVRH
jgi:hypothetical protein